MAKKKKKSEKKAAEKSVHKTAKKVAKKSAPKKSAPKKAAPKKAAPKKAKTTPEKSGKRFLIIYHAPTDAMAQIANASPEEMAEGMAMWKAWAERAGSNLVDLGAPLVNGMRLHPNGSTGSSNKEVTGYSLIVAEDWEDLMDLLSGHPHISGWDPNAWIEIHETMLIPGM
jgi:hypothetical protein